MLFPVHKFADKTSLEKAPVQSVLFYNQSDKIYMLCTNCHTIVQQDVTNFFCEKDFEKDHELFFAVPTVFFSDLYDTIKKNKFSDSCIDFEKKQCYNLNLVIDNESFWHSQKELRFDTVMQYLFADETYYEPCMRSFHLSDEVLNFFKHFKNRRISISPYRRKTSIDQTINIIETIDDFPKLKICSLGAYVSNYSYA